MEGGSAWLPVCACVEVVEVGRSLTDARRSADIQARAHRPTFPWPPGLSPWLTTALQGRCSQSRGWTPPCLRTLQPHPSGLGLLAALPGRQSQGSHSPDGHPL